MNRKLTIMLIIVLVLIVGAVLGYEAYMDKLAPEDAVAQHANQLNQQILKARQDIDAINAALQQYRHDHFKLPSNQQGLAVLVKRAENVSPTDPNYSVGYLTALPKDAWGKDYIYKYPGDYSEYDLYSYGEDGVEDDDDIGNWLQNKGSHVKNWSKYSILGAAKERTQ
ncbi:MAG: type II secretion system major pseudopilin GspG [Thiotrichales bacterium]|jgi:general secretion pathway protein G|nr:type II secretion system major pseudopilin GspG [Thiotrichales bacterium]